MSTDSERAYATYILGNNLGFKMLSTTYKLEIGKSRSMEENIAIFLAYSGYLKDNQTSSSLAKPLFNLDDLRINFVEASELSRMVKENRFGSNFLLHYRSAYKNWAK